MRRMYDIVFPHLHAQWKCFDNMKNSTVVGFSTGPISSLGRLRRGSQPQICHCYFYVSSLVLFIHSGLAFTILFIHPVSFIVSFLIIWIF